MGKLTDIFKLWKINTCFKTAFFNWDMFQFDLTFKNNCRKFNIVEQILSELLLCLCGNFSSYAAKQIHQRQIFFANSAYNMCFYFLSRKNFNQINLEAVCFISFLTLVFFLTLL